MICWGTTLYSTLHICNLPFFSLMLHGLQQCQPHLFYDVSDSLSSSNFLLFFCACRKLTITTMAQAHILKTPNCVNSRGCRSDKTKHLRQMLFPQLSLSCIPLHLLLMTLNVYIHFAPTTHISNLS